jgi:hypothetical protein
MSEFLQAEHCHRCGAVVGQSHETVPYVGPGARVVELRDLNVWRCGVCANMTIDVPEVPRLEALIRCLGREMEGTLPQLAYEMGDWCILPTHPVAQVNRRQMN